MDEETFKTMWDMSREGAPSEQCFMRLPQTEYYCEKREEDNCLEVMPDVRPPFHFILQITVLLSPVV